MRWRSLSLCRPARAVGASAMDRRTACRRHDVGRPFRSRHGADAADPVVRHGRAHQGGATSPCMGGVRPCPPGRASAGAALPLSPQPHCRPPAVLGGWILAYGRRFDERGKTAAGRSPSSHRFFVQHEIKPAPAGHHAGQPASAVVRLAGLYSALRAAADRPGAHPVRARHLRNHPAQTVEDRRAA
jgi:hypothetical protein